MEFVDVEPVRVKKITDEQRNAVCRYSTIKPRDYYHSIKDIRQNSQQQCFEQDPFIAAWNLGVDINMLKLPARVLPMPEIVYTPRYRVTPEVLRDFGVWEFKSTQFHTPADFPAVWAMINLASIDEQSCKEFYNELSSVARHRGINCPPPSIYEERDAKCYSTDQITNVLIKMMNKNDDCKFFLVILPINCIQRTHIYGKLKKQVKQSVVSENVRILLCPLV
jgi:hypothetical protein